MTISKIHDLIDELEDAVEAYTTKGYAVDLFERYVKARRALFAALKQNPCVQDPWAAHLEVIVDGVPQELDWGQQAELEGERAVSDCGTRLHPLFDAIFESFAPWRPKP